MMVAGLGLPALPVDPTYKAVITPSNQKSVVGTIITLDARNSFNPNSLPLVYFWAFKEVPIGSQVDKYLFTSTEIDDSIVSFSPDVPGFYRIQLIIADINNLSPPTEAEVLISILMVSQNQGLTPDNRAKTLWNSLGDFWNLYSERDKYTTIWSSFIQIISNEMLSSFQVDYNKSIKDIQDYFQKKWLSYSPKLDLSENCKFILSEDRAGLLAQTSLINVITQPDYSNVITIPKTDGDFTTTTFGKPTIAGKLVRIGNSSYTTIRSSNSGLYSSVFIDRQILRTGLTNLSWRTSSTLTSDIDLEAQGVSIGDVLVLELSRKGTNLKVPVNVQITAVDRFKISFVFNTEELISGTPSNLISDEDKLTIANSLMISGLTENPMGGLIYTDEALEILNTISTATFKRTYYESLLDQNSVINLGPLSITIKPLHIVRNKRIALSNLVVSIPTLQEYVKQPNLVINGSTISRAVNSTLIPMEREPIVLFENTDYFIDNDAFISAKCNLTALSDTVTIPFGDLIDRDIQENDLLIIDSGLNANQYTIKQILTSEAIKITPTPSTTQSGVKCRIVRRVPIKFLRFVNDLFSPKNKAPISLWGEVTFIDNNPIVEKNFGLLVELTKEQRDRQNINAPYKAAVAGLMFAYSRGPTITNLKLGAQILLGLPFTYHRGVIIDINPEYKLDDNLAPLFGRILIEERTASGKKTGLTDIYFYPRGKQKFNIMTGKWEDQDPDFAGLGINPVTGRLFEVGDFVDQFVVLSKGVEITDYLSDTAWFNAIVGQSNFIANIQKYHKAYLRANPDLYGTADFGFVASFLRKTKPHYIDLLPVALRSFADDVVITDDIFFKPIYTFYEATDLSLPNAAKFDGYYLTPEYLTYDGVMYTRYLYGNDLSTSQANSIVTTQAGGIINPRINELHDTPYIRPGDLLWITNGVNYGKYPIDTIIDDNNLSLNTTSIFQTLTSQDFSIYRPITNPIYTGEVSVTNASPDITFPSGGEFSAGIAVNDTLVFLATTSPSRKYTVTQIDQSGIKVFPYIVEGTGTYDVVIVRDDLLTKSLLDDESVEPFIAQTTNGDPWISFLPINLLHLGIADKNDTIYIQGHPPYTILDFDNNLRRAYVTPIPTITIGTTAKIWRWTQPSKSMSVDIVDRFIRDPLDIQLNDLNFTCSVIAGSETVLLIAGADDPRILGIRPGDFFKFSTGIDSGIDLGYGSGVYPIAEVAATQIKLTRPVVATQNIAPYSYIKKIR